MALDRIDWNQSVADARLRVEQNAAETLELFVLRATNELSDLYVSDDEIAHMHKAGLAVVGLRFFQTLFNENDSVSYADRTKSAFVGSIVFERADMVADAYSAYGGRFGLPRTDTDLLDSVNKAIRRERNHRYGSSKHTLSLDEVSGALGKSYTKRWGTTFMNTLISTGRVN